MPSDEMYEMPLWEQITHCMRMLDTALLECKSRGKAMVSAEADSALAADSSRESASSRDLCRVSRAWEK